jgi:hypothetical protein
MGNMKTILNIDMQTYFQAQAEAKRIGISLTRFIEDAVRSKLSSMIRKGNQTLESTEIELKNILQAEQAAYDEAHLGLES